MNPFRLESVGLAWVAVVTLLLLQGCGVSNAPRVHVASATSADLQAVQEEKEVWYEFRPGDVVPFQFMLIGVAVSAHAPVEMRAQERFWIVMRDDGPMQISFDGSTYSSNQVELVTAVLPGEGDRAQVYWINYVGEGDAAEELKRLGAQGQQQPSAPPPGAQTASVK